MLPEGISLGRLHGPLSTLASIIPRFTGVVRIREPGVGFVLVLSGNPYAAAFEESAKDLLLWGDEAYRYMLDWPSFDCELLAYTAEETEEAREASRKAQCLLSEGGAESASWEEPVGTSCLDQIAQQPGVVAVSVFHEGFALQSFGSADFEQVAAVAEDLLRAGTRITADMEMGDLSQVILETPEGKIIIAPYGDPSLCILTKPDANLGLIRLAIRNLQDNPE